MNLPGDDARKEQGRAGEDHPEELEPAVEADEDQQKVVRRQLLIRPGDRFSRTALVRSQREVFQLGFFEDVKVDFEKFVATKKGRAVSLTSKELEVLRYLIRRQGKVVTRDQLLNQVWGYDASPTTRTVDTHIFKLRRKLEPDPANPRHILSVYGGGYMFVS